MKINNYKWERMKKRCLELIEIVGIKNITLRRISLMKIKRKREATYLLYHCTCWWFSDTITQYFFSGQTERSRNCNAYSRAAEMLSKTGERSDTTKRDDEPDSRYRGPGKLAATIRKISTAEARPRVRLFSCEFCVNQPSLLFVFVTFLNFLFIKIIS